jgi:RimJ/RimL family protein N-acetyltransferase
MSYLLSPRHPQLPAMLNRRSRHQFSGFHACRESAVTDDCPHDGRTALFCRAGEHIARCMALAAEQPRRGYDMGIALRSTGAIIGGITLHVFDHADDEAAFSYLLNRAHWRQSYATEALTEMLCFGFTQLDLRRITDSCDVENSASARVMEKCGLHFEGERDGARLYALTASEWRERL